MDTKKYKGLPLYKLIINEHEDAFVDAIGIVKQPAIGVTAQYFAKISESSDISVEIKKTETKQLFTTGSKQELLAAAMIPDLPMFRPANELKNHDHYVVFTAEEIRTIARVFFAKGCMNNINIGHTEQPAHSNTFISYFIDEDKGIGTPKGMEKLPEGTWICGMYINDKSLFEKLSNENFGLSVEGIFGYTNFSKVEETIEVDEYKIYEDFLKSIK